MINKCIFIGNVGGDPEVKQVGDAKVANFNIGVTKTWKDKGGEKQTKTEWVRLVAWRGLAEVAEKYVRKGQQVYVEGEMETRSYEKEGQTHYTTTINLDTMKLLGKRSAEATEGPGPQTASDFGIQEPGKKENTGQGSTPEDDLPF